MTRSCSAKGDEKYLVKGLKRTITMLSLLKWAACRNNAMFSCSVIWWCTNSQDASFDMILMQIFWCKDSQTRQLMWVWCKDSDGKIHKRIIWCDDAKILILHKFCDVMIKKCDDAQILGKRERDGTKLGEMQISRESTRRVHRCPASSSHHLCILSNSYRALRNCTKLQAVCADLASRGSLLISDNLGKITSCALFQFEKNPEARQSTQRQHW